ncbi:MAG: S41 family peptidase [Acidobacteriota bacterium]
MAKLDGYYRHPTLSGDLVVFVAEDELCSVSAEGGEARRLTAGWGAASFPVLSPDGTKVAFTSRHDGSEEAFVLDLDGGVPRRLSHTGGPTRTVAWSAEGDAVIYQTMAGQAFRGNMVLDQAPIDGSPIERLPLGPAREISYEPDGYGTVLSRNAGDPARWKRYRGGTAGTLWIDRDGEGEYAPLIKLDGNLAAPFWVGKRIFFLSDHEGHGNIYSCLPTGRGLKRHTNHQDYYVRYPGCDGERFVYQAGADLYLLDPSTDEVSSIEIDFPVSGRDRSRIFVAASDWHESSRLHPEGHSLASIVRGGLFTFGAWDGAPQRHGPVSSSRQRLAAWLSDGEHVVSVSDEDGEENLVVRRADGTGTARTIKGDFGRVLDLEPSPAGPLRVAVANHRQELFIVDLAGKGKKRRVDVSEHDRIGGMSWAPDGRHLAYGFSHDRRSSCIRIVEAAKGKPQDVTGSDFIDHSPVFDPEGRYLYFLSHRVFDPIYDNQYFDLGFPKGTRPHLVTLRADEPSPFDSAARSPQPPRLEPPRREDEKDGKDNKIEIELDGIAERVLAFPVEEGIYRSIVAAPDRVFFTSVPPEGSLGQTWADGDDEDPKVLVQVYDYERHRTEDFLEAVSDLSGTPDGRSLLVRIGRKLRLLSGGLDPKDVPPPWETGREGGWIDIDRLSVEVVPGLEWVQMFDEAWRLQRDHFWTPDMSKIDWNGVHDRYRPLVDRVATRGDFSDLLWELQGELGTSHCYELGGDYRHEPDWTQGHLGADFEWDSRAKAWKVSDLPRGDSWEPDASSPLLTPGANVSVGDQVLAIDGVELSATRSPQSCLVDRAGRELTVRVRSGKSEPRSVSVRALGNEMPLRYRAQVEANREWVHAESSGRVGYVHVPDMGPRGYSEFHRYFQSEMDRPGLIIDVRYNGGGHVSELLLEKLLRRRIGGGISRWMGEDHYPSEAPVGPMVALTNELAGSDGDIFSHSFKLFELGPLIGKRTWGGVVGIWPRHALVDGTITTQAEFACWFTDVGWDVENYGTDPDVEVDNLPQDHAAGRDQQLERALFEVKQLVRHAGRPARPPLRRPNLKPPRLRR